MNEKKIAERVAKSMTAAGIRVPYTKISSPSQGAWEGKEASLSVEILEDQDLCSIGKYHFQRGDLDTLIDTLNSVQRRW